MKKTFSFRLSPKISQSISLIAKEYDLTATEVVETAVDKFAKSFSKKKCPLDKYFGSVDPKYADELLDNIMKSRKNKDLSKLVL